MGNLVEPTTISLPLYKCPWDNLIKNEFLVQWQILLVVEPSIAALSPGSSSPVTATLYVASFIHE